MPPFVITHEVSGAFSTNVRLRPGVMARLSAYMDEQAFVAALPALIEKLQAKLAEPPETFAFQGAVEGRYAHGHERQIEWWATNLTLNQTKPIDLSGATEIDARRRLYELARFAVYELCYISGIEIVEWRPQ